MRNGLYHRSCHSQRKLVSKTAFITGASAGIGKETARDLAARGARVILGCRNITKAKQVKDDIIRSTGNRNVAIYQLDTSDLASVRRCAQEILSSESRIDILVNNAGISGTTDRRLTKDSLELTMATNYYELIKKSKPARIVNVSSGLHTFCHFLDAKDLNFEKITFGVLASYSQSKLCNILFTMELSRKLRGTGVTATSVHPGLVATEIFEKSDYRLLKLLQYLPKFGLKSEKAGAQTTIYAAVSEETENMTGTYFDNCQARDPSPLARDVELSQQVWRETIKHVNLQPNEIHYSTRNLR